jgi:hypothetical protein
MLSRKAYIPERQKAEMNTAAQEPGALSFHIKLKEG